MSQEEPTIHDEPSGQAALGAPVTATYQPVDDTPAGGEHDAWLEQPAEPELPRRPRRRLLGRGANPVPIALIAVLVTACGFIGGVLVEKGQSSSGGSNPGGGIASRLASLRSGGGGRAGASGGGTSALLAGAGASGGAVGAGGGGRGGATFGQVAYVSGHTLYVTDAEGNTVKVSTSDASTVTKTVKADIKAIHPGETVVVTGSAGANGAVSAETIRVSEAGAAGGGIGVLFGGGAGFGAARGGGSEGSTRAGGSGGGGEQALFGK